MARQELVRLSSGITMISNNCADILLRQTFPGPFPMATRHLSQLDERTGEMGGA